MEIKNFGLYSLDDSFFNKFNDKYLPDNKNSNRPYYCAIQDNNGLIWFVPLSSQVENYKLKISKDTQKFGSCLFYHICNIAGKESAFLIGDMFPVTIEYIKKEYTYNNVHYIVKNQKDIKEIQKRVKKYLALFKQGKLEPHIDISSIIKELNN